MRRVDILPSVLQEQQNAKMKRIGAGDEKVVRYRKDEVQYRFSEINYKVAAFKLHSWRPVKANFLNCTFQPSTILGFVDECF